MVAAPIIRYLQELASFSRKFFVVAAIIAAIPALIGVSWILFPSLEVRNLGYPVWHFSCLAGILLSCFGVTCWVAERLSECSNPSLFSLVALVSLGAGAIASLVFGEFYWAFERGFFLS